MKHCLCLSTIALAVFAGPAASQSFIDISGDPFGGSCSIPVSPGSAGTAHIYYLGQLTEISGAEFALAGWPGWTASVTPGPGVTVIGDPLSTQGCFITFSSCPSAMSARISLFTVSFQAPVSVPSDIPLQVVAVPTQSCPRVFRCDSPLFTPVCVDGGRSWMNPSSWQPPELLFPADGANGQPVTGVALAWNCRIPPEWACTTSAFDPLVYFGTDPDPPLVRDGSGPLSTHVTGPLSGDTTYYWRIRINGSPSGLSSPVWRFTTETPIGVESAAWQQVKMLFR